MPGMKRGENIYLVGLMGAGRPPWQAAGARLKLRFVRFRPGIERPFAGEDPLIWEIEGEAGFRGREAQVSPADCAGRRGVATEAAPCCSTKTQAPAGAARGLSPGKPRELYGACTTPQPAAARDRRSAGAAARAVCRAHSLYRGVADLVIGYRRQSVQALARELLKSWKGNESLRVALGERSYPITSAAASSMPTAAVRAALPAGSAAVVTNEVVGPLYLPRVKKALEGGKRARGRGRAR